MFGMDEWKTDKNGVQMSLKSSLLSKHTVDVSFYVFGINK